MGRKLTVASTIFALLLAFTAYTVWSDGDNGQLYNTLPTSNATFLSDLQTLLKTEAAKRFQDTLTSFVKSGGVISTGAGVTKTPTALTAYPGGYLVTESGAITFPLNSTCFVIADKDRTGNLTTYTRVAGTHYLMDCASGKEPSLPTVTTLRIATIVTDGTSVTTSTDRRTTSPIPSSSVGAPPYTIGDLFYAPSSSTIAQISDAATGNALISGGVGAAPTYGKVGLTTHISGQLPTANGGFGGDRSSDAQGTIYYVSATGVISALAPGVSGKFLKTQGAASNPTWDAPSASTLKMMFAGGAGAAGLIAGTKYYSLGFSIGANATEGNVSVPMALAGTFKNLYIRTNSAQPGDGSLVFTARKNAADTTVTVTVSAGGAAQLVSDTTHNFTVVAGDLITLKVLNNAATTSALVAGISIEFDAS